MRELLALCLLLWSSLLQAQVFPYYYDGVVVANGTQPTKLDIQKGLEQVFLRIANIDQLTLRDKEKIYFEVIEHASDLMESYELATFPEREESFFVIHYSAQQIESALKEESRAVWGPLRPGFVWFQAYHDQEGNLYILDESQDHNNSVNNRRSLNEEARSRGIELTYTLADIPDRLAMLQAISEPSFHNLADYLKERYQADGVVIGYGESIGSNQTEFEWYLYGEEDGLIRANYAGNGDNSVDILGEVASYYYEQRAERSREQELVRVVIQGVLDYEAFKQIASRMFSTFGYEKVKLEGVNFNAAEFSVLSDLGTLWVEETLGKVPLFNLLPQNHIVRSSSPVLVIEYLD